MLIPIPVLRARLAEVLENKTVQGQPTANLAEVLALLPRMAKLPE